MKYQHYRYAGFKVQHGEIKAEKAMKKIGDTGEETTLMSVSVVGERATSSLRRK